MNEDDLRLIRRSTRSAEVNTRQKKCQKNGEHCSVKRRVLSCLRIRILITKNICVSFR